MMLRSTKPCIQTAGKLFPMTLMNFTVVNFIEIKVTHSCRINAKVGNNFISVLFIDC